MAKAVSRTAVKKTVKNISDKQTTYEKLPASVIARRKEIAHRRTIIVTALPHLESSVNKFLTSGFVAEVKFCQPDSETVFYWAKGQPGKRYALTVNLEEIK